MCDDAGVKATFLCWPTPTTIESGSRLLLVIEIGCHGYSHALIYSQTQAQLRKKHAAPRLSKTRPRRRRWLSGRELDHRHRGGSVLKAGRTQNDSACFGATYLYGTDVESSGPYRIMLGARI
jgi:hypothetical protein